MTWDFFFRLLVAGVLGALVGVDREYRAKEAGFRTHFLVALGSALFMIVSKYGFADVLSVEGISVDASRIAAGVVSAIGFLGAGVIFVRNDSSSMGLTTAAGLWATVGVGIAAGAGMYAIAALATLIMPAEEMRPEDVDAWISQTETVEIAEQASMNLYQYIPFVKNESLKWIASEDELRQLCGFHVLSRMFMKGFVPEKQVADEFLARAMSAISSKSLTVGKAAFASVVRFAGLNEQNNLQAQKAMDSIGIEL